MKTEEVIQWFHRDPFKCNEQTTLVRARNGVLMAKQNVSGADVFCDSGKKEYTHAVTGKEAKEVGLKDDERHHLGRAYDNPDDFFADDDITKKDWVPLVVALPDSITKREDDGQHTFIGADQPGSWSTLFHSSTLFARRDAKWAYGNLYNDCILHLPMAAMHGVRIPARSRTVDPIGILLRVFHKVFVDVCGKDKAALNWQLGWAHYLTNNCAIRVNARNTFGAEATKFLNSPKISLLETRLETIKKAVLTEEPLEYVGRWESFSTALQEAYSADSVDTDVIGSGVTYVISHIVEEEFPFVIHNGHYADRDMYKVVDANWKARAVHNDSLYQTDYEKACDRMQRRWDKLFSEDTIYEPNECFMGMEIPSFSKLRDSWPVFVDLFERLGYPEPKPFGFSLCDENEESLAILRDTAAAQMADPSTLLEVEAEETMSILG